MALSGSVTTTTSYSRSVTLSWTATQSVANNQSTISWVLKGSGSASGWVQVSEIKITINGSQAYYRDSSNHTQCYSGTQLCSGSTTINHNSDGTKSFSIKVEAGIYNWAINCSGTQTFTLDTIARASSISSASNVTLGNACSVSWTPASSSFRYKVKFALGSWNYTTDYISPNRTTSYTYNSYTIPLTVANQLPSATTGTMTAYLYSYNGSTQIGSTASKTFTVTVPSTVVPSVGTLTATMVNVNATINSWGVAVAGYTKVRVSATASGSYGSTISSFTITGGYSTTQNGTSLSYTGAVIQSSGNKSFSVIAKDSRGRSSTQATSSIITFYTYSKPSISSFTAARSSSNSQQVVVKANWSYASVNSKNSATAKLYYKRSTATSWTNYGDITSSKNTNLTLSGVTFNDAYSYNFKVEVTDALGNKVQEEEFVSTVAVLMDFRAGGQGLGIGKIAESNSLEVALPTIFMDSVKIRIGSSDITLKNYIEGVMNGTYT